MIHKTIKIVAQSLLISLPLFARAMDGNSNSNLSAPSTAAAQAANQAANNSTAALATDPVEYHSILPTDAARELLEKLNRIESRGVSTTQAQLPAYHQLDEFKSINKALVYLKIAEYLLLDKHDHGDAADRFLNSAFSPAELAFFLCVWQELNS